MCAKLGFAQTRGRVNWSEFDNLGVFLDSGRDSTTFTGFSYGAGFKHKFTPNIYGMAEIMQTDFRRKTWSNADGSWSEKPRTLAGIIGIGYKF